MIAHCKNDEVIDKRMDKQMAWATIIRLKTIGPQETHWVGESIKTFVKDDAADVKMIQGEGDLAQEAAMGACQERTPDLKGAVMEPLSPDDLSVKKCRAFGGYPSDPS